MKTYLKLFFIVGSFSLGVVAEARQPESLLIKGPAGGGGLLFSNPTHDPGGYSGIGAWTEMYWVDSGGRKHLLRNKAVFEVNLISKYSKLSPSRRFYMYSVISGRLDGARWQTVRDHRVPRPPSQPRAD